MENRFRRTQTNFMKHIHFIGICGVAMSALAIAFKKAGFEVSGSDAGFFSPVSTNLEKHKINFYPGWHPEKMGTPDLVVIGNVASSTNPEWLHVQKNNLPYKSYPEVIAKYFVKDNSIVCAGTYGKTTTSALLSFVLTECGYNPSYMFGGIATNDFDSASLGTTVILTLNEVKGKDPLNKIKGIPRSTQNYNWSVLEGDEYKTARWDNGAKFFHYQPTHLLLTAIEWDHADVYPTEKSYFKAFEKLIKMVPEKGLIVANENISDIRYQIADRITYGKSDSVDYKYSDIKQTKNGIKFKITHHDNCYLLSAQMIGDYIAENICGIFALVHQIGIEPDKTITAISKFKGLKRRLEKRYEGKVIVFDDIAHSPAKAKFTLATLRKIYNDKILAIFEPNTGNRQPQSETHYNEAFQNADEVIIPRLTKLKLKPGEEPHWEGNKLAQVIGQTHKNVKYIGDDKTLIEYIIKNTTNNDVVVFLGSHGFRGMIDDLITCLRQPPQSRPLRPL